MSLTGLFLYRSIYMYYFLLLGEKLLTSLSFRKQTGRSIRVPLAGLTVQRRHMVWQSREACGFLYLLITWDRAWTLWASAPTQLHPTMFLRSQQPSLEKHRETAANLNKVTIKRKSWRVFGFKMTKLKLLLSLKTTVFSPSMDRSEGSITQILKAVSQPLCVFCPYCTDEIGHTWAYVEKKWKTTQRSHISM